MNSIRQAFERACDKILNSDRRTGTPRSVVENESGYLVVENTGEATQTGDGDAVTGYKGPKLKRGQKVVVRNTGNATATGDGSAVSGIDWS